jgi:methionine sulfoxide reductase heme-binding subunit
LASARRRICTHVVLAALTAGGVWLTADLRPDASLAHVLTIGLGYAGLVFGAATLLIGPLSLWRRRRNPVNVDLRRDVGIWAGITGLLHVVYGLQIHLGGRILRYFFEAGGYRPLLDLFGASNWVGGAATILLALLLLLSNDVSLRWLRGPRWKTLQRLNYVLFPAVLAHTAGYQLVVRRDAVLVILTVALTALVAVAQMAGLAAHRAREASARG